nr:SCO2522 family protein [Parafrankia sp. EUN1f]
MSVEGATATARVMFRETSAVERTVEVPLSHVSVELGHFYPEDFRDQGETLRRQFRRIAPWVDRSRVAALAGIERGNPRVATCLLVDDYSERETMPPPGTVVPELLAAAADSGLRIDYIARESACAEDGAVPLAPLVEKLLVPDPPDGTNGSRPPVHESGWLCNGSRSPATIGAAMGPARAWKPPAENASRRHSVFLDVELRGARDPAETRWSCAFLAAVWQLLRLGLVRARGENVVTPVPVDPADLPDRWSDFPAIGQMRGGAPPFCAYRTFSALDTTYLPVEHAVRVILGQVGVDPTVLQFSARRAEKEGIVLPAEPTGRISYLFLGP